MGRKGSIMILLAQLFTTNHHEVEDFTAVNWLAQQTEEVLQKIVDYSDSFYEYAEEEDADPSMECVDYLTLCYMVAEKEKNSAELSDRDKENSLMALALFATYEQMRRKDLIRFTGSGKVVNFHLNYTDIEFTQMGKMVGSSIKTLSELASQM